MAQLHFYLPDDEAEQIRRKAREQGEPLSRYLGKLIRQTTGSRQWPEGYFERIFGGWQGEPLQRPEQGEAEQRESL